MTEAPPPDIDMDRAFLDPAATFGTPEAILADAGLATEQKIELLRRWVYDASELSMAVEEGMPGRDGDLLRRILVALSQLTGGIDVEQVGPTKHHGIPRSAVRRT